MQSFRQVKPKHIASRRYARDKENEAVQPQPAHKESSKNPTIKCLESTGAKTLCGYGHQTRCSPHTAQGSACHQCLRARHEWNRPCTGGRTSLLTLRIGKGRSTPIL